MFTLPCMYVSMCGDGMAVLFAIMYVYGKSKLIQVFPLGILVSTG